MSALTVKTTTLAAPTAQSPVTSTGVELEFAALSSGIRRAYLEDLSYAPNSDRMKTFRSEFNELSISHELVNHLISLSSDRLSAHLKLRDLPQDHQEVFNFAYRLSIAFELMVLPAITSPNWVNANSGKVGEILALGEQLSQFLAEWGDLFDNRQREVPRSIEKASFHVSRLANRCKKLLDACNS